MGRHDLWSSQHVKWGPANTRSKTWVREKNFQCWAGLQGLRAGTLRGSEEQSSHRRVQKMLPVSDHIPTDHRSREAEHPCSGPDTPRHPRGAWEDLFCTHTARPVRVTQVRWDSRLQYVQGARKSFFVYYYSVQLASIKVIFCLGLCLFALFIFICCCCVWGFFPLFLPSLQGFFEACAAQGLLLGPGVVQHCRVHLQLPQAWVLRVSRQPCQQHLLTLFTS